MDLMEHVHLHQVQLMLILVHVNCLVLVLMQIMINQLVNLIHHVTGLHQEQPQVVQVIHVKL